MIVSVRVSWPSRRGLLTAQIYDAGRVVWPGMRPRFLALELSSTVMAAAPAALLFRRVV
jgi:hypothetical protein